MLWPGEEARPSTSPGGDGAGPGAPAGTPLPAGAQPEPFPGESPLPIPVEARRQTSGQTLDLSSLATFTAEQLPLGYGSLGGRAAAAVPARVRLADHQPPVPQPGSAPPPARLQVRIAPGCPERPCSTLPPLQHDDRDEARLLSTRLTCSQRCSALEASEVSKGSDC